MLNAVVDVYHGDDISDWTKVSKAGIVGVIHKATQGLSYVDPKYSAREIAATKIGLSWGAYHFATRADGTAQADHFLAAAKPGPDTLIALDLETWKGGTVTAIQAVQFIRRIFAKLGRYPWLYGSDILTQFLEHPAPEFKQCLNWIARYGAHPPAVPWKLWQYTDGKVGNAPREVPGIGPCDRNIFDGTLEELKTVWAFRPALIPEPPAPAVLPEPPAPVKENSAVINNFHPVIEETFHYVLDRVDEVVEQLRSIPLVGGRIADYLERVLGDKFGSAMKWAEERSDAYFGKPPTDADSVQRANALADRVRKMFPEAAKVVDAKKNDPNYRPESVV